MLMKTSLVTIFTIFIFLACYSQQKTIDQRVDSVLSLMTVEEKVGQMNQYTGFWNVTGPPPVAGRQKKQYEQLKKGLIGSMLNVRGVKEVRKIQEIAVNETRLGIPLIFGFDVIHGYKTLSPIPLAESCSWDLEAIEQSARIAAIEASAVGLNWTFAPMVDISRDARWGRVMEGAGEDPYYASKVAVARVQGFQGDDLSQPNTIAACAKHFAAYGFVESGRDYNAVDIGNYTLYNVIFPPFKAAVEKAKVRTVMNSFSTLNGIPATGSNYLQRGILKEKWGFDGFVISDWGSTREMVDHGYAEDLRDAAVKAAVAGSDMDMESEAYVSHLADLVNSGTVSEKIIDEAVGRILKVKFELGLMDDPYKYCDLEREKELLYHESHKTTAYDIAKKSIVLLKNENHLLPLSTQQKKIAVIGDLADDDDSPLGSWRIGSDNNSAVTLLEGLKRCTSNITYERGVKFITEKADFIHHVKINDQDKSGMDKAIALAKESEVVILALGEHGFMTGEGRSRTRIGIPKLQEEMMKEILRVNKNVVLVLMNGRPLDLSWVDRNIPAVLECWQLGSESGNAIADVLFGKYNPSGKLTMSFPRNVGQVPIYYNNYNTGRPRPVGRDVGTVFHSHYGDEKNDALYPFGFGLSYTTFEYSGFNVELKGPKHVGISVTVKNTGELDGEEVVQLYIRDITADVVRPVKELKGFEKIMLKSQESKQIKFQLTEEELGYYNLNGEFVFEPGSFDIMIGTNSAEVLTKRIEVR